MAFSSVKGPTPSLDIIFKELERTGFSRTDYNLSSWAKQGVLLLNTILTTRLGYSLAHEHYGWQDFTAEVIRYRIASQEPLVIMAWGRPAQDSIGTILRSIPYETDHVRVLKAYHPVAEHRQPAKYKFVGCNHFVEANDWLVGHDRTPIQWQN